MAESTGGNEEMPGQEGEMASADEFPCVACAGRNKEL